jgi:hypothetical protein
MFSCIQFLPAVSAAEMRGLLLSAGKGGFVRSPAPIYGVVAEFGDRAALVAAARSLAEAGYKRFEAYTPFPVEELSEIIKPRRRLLPLIVFAGGIVGGAGGFFMQYYAAAVGYPLNVGGRPLNSWPMFVPITFELSVLAAALAAVFGVLVLSRLPMPYHPLFKVKEFERASRDGFFLCVEATDRKFDLRETSHFLMSLNSLGVSSVEF